MFEGRIWMFVGVFICFITILLFLFVIEFSGYTATVHVFGTINAGSAKFTLMVLH